MTELEFWVGMNSREKYSDCLLISIPPLQLALHQSPQTWSSKTAVTRSRSPSSTACSSVSRSALLPAKMSPPRCCLIFVSFCCCLVPLPLHGMQRFSDLFVLACRPRRHLYPLSSGIAGHVKKNIEGEIPLLLLLLAAACFFTV